jgi:hypothetical protein
MEEVKIWSSLEELLGVWGTECCESKRRNKGDLVRFGMNPKTEAASQGTNTLNGVRKWICPELFTVVI